MLTIGTQFWLKSANTQMAMRQYWNEELTEEEVTSLCQKIATHITKRKLEAPAILMLELHKPLANINSHLALMFSGFISPIVGYDMFNDLTRLLANRDNIERLLLTIESQVEERDQKPKLSEGES